jgi:Response regulator containing CheY-like receiver, AAA-type ATPase, and DNA-binding domains
MSMTEQIGPHLPYLRRFARALCGSQMSGDAYVAATLEAIIANRGVLDDRLEPRLSLYKLFLTLWNDAPVNSKALVSGEEEDRLDRLTPPSRQAFLLTAVEGFTAEEAAAVMSLDAATFAAHADKAAREIAEQVATDVLIIEDEPIIAMDLESLVEELGHRVIDVARTHKEAIAVVARKTPGLVLADIQLADGSSGLDAVNEILATLEVPVIFITAYPERLLTGEKPEPAFLITKPFQTNTLSAVISQALFFNEKSSRRSNAA